MTRQITFSTMDQEIRLHALNLAMAGYTKSFQVRPTKDDEGEGFADQVLSDARKYAEWLKRGDDVNEAVS